MDKLITTFIDGLIFISAFLSIIYALYFFKYNKSYKYFTIYLIHIAIIQLLLFVFAKMSIRSVFLFHIYFIIQFIFLSLFYKSLLQKKWISYSIYIVLTVLIIQFLLDPSIIDRYNSLGVIVTQSVIVLYSILYFYKSLTYKSEFILVNTGILLYFLTSIIFFSSNNTVINLNISLEVQRQLFAINNIVYFIFIILIFIEWWRNYRKKVTVN
jgi:hypothetical protein